MLAPIYGAVVVKVPGSRIATVHTKALLLYRLRRLLSPPKKWPGAGVKQPETHRSATGLTANYSAKWQDYSIINS